VSDAARPVSVTPGRFIVIEGGEGCGKSTQATALAAALGAILTREPGGTHLGERLRSVALDPALGRLDPRAEFLLMASARAQHVASVIRPGLESGRDVICDRFSGSSVAYQGYGRGLDPSRVGEISLWASDGLSPDLVILLQVSQETAAARRHAREAGSTGPDRIESEGQFFHQLVADGFAAQAEANPELWAVISGEGEPAEVHTRVLAVFFDRLGIRGGQT
jgi:dTMP kinase